MEHLQYPIGRFDRKSSLASHDIQNQILTLREFPSKLSDVLREVNTEDLEKTYRSGGWTIRQLVHHLSDSHANMLIRVKSALTKTKPTVMGYDENAWGELADNTLPIELSVQMLTGIHAKVCHLFQQLDAETWEKTYFHNGDERFYTLREVAALYAWHSEHHLAHIRIAMAS